MSSVELKASIPTLKVERTGPDFQIPDTLGTRRGGNLFHSFDQFNIRTTLADGIQSATFTGPAGIDNVISRVTGSEASTINGKLASTISGADVFFINPNGVAFGPNASLDVRGSFHVSTADELRFADGTTFSATAPNTGSFTMAPPEAFGFLGPAAGSIVVDGSTLSVDPGATLTLAGGDLIVGGRNHGTASGGDKGRIAAPGGRLAIAALRGPGTVRVTDGTVEASEFADISLDHQSHFSTDGDGGGALQLRGGTLTLDSRSFISANNTGSTAAGQGVQISAATIEVDDSQIVTTAFDSGAAGPITISTHNLIVNQSSLSASTLSDGNAGMDVVNANKIILDNLSFPSSTVDAARRPLTC